MAEGDLIQTGIAGLDDILRGGIPKDNMLLVEGAAGMGKTLLGMGPRATIASSCSSCWPGCRAMN